MALRQILHFPDPRLRNRAAPVEVVDEAIRTLIDDMFDTMYDAKGIGLAAPQIDVHLRVLVTDISPERDAPVHLINPRIVARDGIEAMEEGCLSVPGVYELVERADHIVVEALDREGRPFRLEASGLLAVCIQHEIDHLDGKLFIDYLSQLKRTRIRKKFDKAQRQAL
jgi:peptide deformylase